MKPTNIDETLMPIYHHASLRLISLTLQREKVSRTARELEAEAWYMKENPTSEERMDYLASLGGLSRFNIPTMHGIKTPNCSKSSIPCG
jgi:hypothetical protein